MFYAALKALLSGVIIAAASEVAKRNPRRLPDPSIAAAIYSRLHLAAARHRRHGADRRAGAIHLLVRIADAADVSGAAGAAQKRHGLWPALGLSCLLTMVLYATMVWALGRFGISL